MVDSTTPLRTIKEIAAELNAEPERVHYICKKRRIAPAARAGLVRLYDPFQVKMIQTGLAGLRHYSVG